jgi:hypothetical protein
MQGGARGALPSSPRAPLDGAASESLAISYAAMVHSQCAETVIVCFISSAGLASRYADVTCSSFTVSMLWQRAKSLRKSIYEPFSCSVTCLRGSSCGNEQARSQQM